MIRDYYTIFHNATDYSLKLKDFTTESISLELADSDYLYVGFFKPFCQFYAELEVLNTNANTFTAEYYNGTTWTALDLTDESEGFTKSGFIYFSRPSAWEKTTVNAEELFYIRLKPSVSHSVGTKLKGMNILFSNDTDLIGIRSNVVSKLNSGDSWIEKHEAAKKMIIQNLRNLGNQIIKTDSSNNPFFQNGEILSYHNVNAQDFIDPFELREASKFLALSMIYLDELSDEAEDKWQVAGERHEKRYEQAVNVFMLRLDLDDDGVEDSNENFGSTRADLVWH